MIGSYWRHARAKQTAEMLANFVIAAVCELYRSRIMSHIAASFLELFRICVYRVFSKSIPSIWMLAVKLGQLRKGSVMKRYKRGGRFSYETGQRRRRKITQTPASQPLAFALLLLVGLFFDATFWLTISVIIGIAAFVTFFTLYEMRVASRSRSDGGHGGTDTSQTAKVPLRKHTSNSGHGVSGEFAIVHPSGVWVAHEASPNLRRQGMTHDTRFALIDSTGRKRYAQILDGTFQIGKAADEKPTDLADFARAILLRKKDGRFRCKTGRMTGILGYGKRECKAYELDAKIASTIGVPERGSI